MASDYANAVRAGSMAAARLHLQLKTRERLEAVGGSVDVFGASFALNLPLLLRPLKGLLGAYLPEPIPGVLVTTERPLSIQRYTAAHELGHFKMDHKPSLDDESILRRMALPSDRDAPGSNFQELEADSFATTFLMPKWLIQLHCQQQGWQRFDLAKPHIVYQLSLRLGASYEAITWTLQRYNLITPAVGHKLRATSPRSIKVGLLKDHKPNDYRGDVWLLTERDSGVLIDGSRNDHFVLRLNEHSGGGYLWNLDLLRESGFLLIRDERTSDDEESVGGPTTRQVTAALQAAQRGHTDLSECRPWQATKPISEFRFDYDFTGPEQEGLSRAEQRQLLEAA